MQFLLVTDETCVGISFSRSAINQSSLRRPSKEIKASPKSSSSAPPPRSSPRFSLSRCDRRLLTIVWSLVFLFSLYIQFISAKMPPKRVKKVMTLPINVIFSHLQVSTTTVLAPTAMKHGTKLVSSSYCCLLCFVWQKKTRVRLWLYEDARMQIEGQIIGFDEYMK